MRSRSRTGANGLAHEHDRTSGMGSRESGARTLTITRPSQTIATGRHRWRRPVNSTELMVWTPFEAICEAGPGRGLFLVMRAQRDVKSRVAPPRSHFVACGTCHCARFAALAAQVFRYMHEELLRRPASSHPPNASHPPDKDHC